jgi:hypothetical protein
MILYHVIWFPSREENQTRRGKSGMVEGGQEQQKAVEQQAGMIRFCEGVS